MSKGTKKVNTNNLEAKLLGEQMPKIENENKSVDYLGECYVYNVNNIVINNTPTYISGNLLRNLLSKEGKQKIKNGELSVIDGEYSIKRIS